MVLVSKFLYDHYGIKSTEENVITAGTSADNPPYEFILGERIVGIDMDIAEELSRILGKRLVIKNFDFPILLSALATSKVDFAIAGMSVSEDRKPYVDFSEVYFSSKIAVLLRKKDKILDSKNMISELRGKVVGAQLGTIWHEVAKDIVSKHAEAKLRLLSSNLFLVEELRQGAVDTVVLEEVQALQFAKYNPELMSITLENYDSDFAIALPKNSNLLDEVNNAIKKMKNEGKIEEIKRKWLN